MNIFKFIFLWLPLMPFFNAASYAMFNQLKRSNSCPINHQKPSTQKHQYMRIELIMKIKSRIEEQLKPSDIKNIFLRIALAECSEETKKITFIQSLCTALNKAEFEKLIQLILQKNDEETDNEKELFETSAASPSLSNPSNDSPIPQDTPYSNDFWTKVIDPERAPLLTYRRLKKQD